MTRPPLPAGPPVAQLRVYEPLHAFPPRARRHWTRYAEARRGHRDAAYLERREAWRSVLAEPGASSAPHGGVAGRVLERGGALYVCPLDLPHRWAVAGRQARQSLPPFVAAVALGPDDSTLPVADPGRPLRTLVAPWALPLEWLVLVRPEDREGATYVVTAPDARARASSVGAALREAFGVSALSRTLDDVDHWLDGFDPAALLELDDEPVARLVGGVEAVEDVRLGVECLLSGDTTGVAAAYRRLRRRGERLLMLARAS